MKGFSTRVALPALAASLTVFAGGCATIYKSTAGDYVDAAKQITVAMQSAEVGRSNAEAQSKIDLIVEDRSCPVERSSGVYLRPAAVGATDIPAHYFTALAHSAGLDSTGAGAPACQHLAACEAKGSCEGTCLDEDESSCVDQIAHYYATSKKDEDKSAADQLRTNMARISYPVLSPDTYLATSSVQALSAYLDLLGKAADGKVKDFKTGATDLANGVKSATSAYKSVVGKSLVPAATSTTAVSSINALGAVIEDIATMVQDAKDTASIKAAVNKNDKNIDGIMSDIETFVVADIQLAGAEMGNSNIEQLAELRKQFAQTSSVTERRAIMVKVQALYADDSAAAVKSAQAVFKKARESHATLVSLINDPTNDQLKQIRAQEFASFRSAATDLGSLIALFIK